MVQTKLAAGRSVNSSPDSACLVEVVQGQDPPLMVLGSKDLVPDGYLVHFAGAFLEVHLTPTSLHFPACMPRGDVAKENVRRPTSSTDVYLWFLETPIALLPAAANGATASFAENLVVGCLSRAAA